MAWKRGICDRCGAARSVYTFHPWGGPDSLSICFPCKKGAERQHARDLARALAENRCPTCNASLPDDFAVCPACATQVLR